MKKQFLALGIAGASILFMAAKSSEPILMNIAGKDVTLGEFEYLYHKNSTQQVQPQSLDEYVQMFIDYKLKVADAEAAGIDTTAAFVKEFSQFRNELAAPYLKDNEVLDSLVRQLYDHTTREVYVSHIMMNMGSEATLDSLRTAILEHKTTFEDVAREYSIDRGTSQQGGRMGWVGVNRYPWAFEEAAYATPQGEISPVINSGFGIHIVRTDISRPSRGEVLVEHILRLTRNVSDSVAQAEAVRIDSIYQAVTAGGADFAQLATTLSQDPGSASKGGRLDWFGTGMMVAEFDSAAFETPVGGYSKPFQSSFGWHIVHKLDQRMPPSIEEARPQLEAQIAGSDRSQMPQRAFALNMIKKYKGKFITKNFERVARMADELGGQYDSTMVAEFSRSDLPLFELGGKKYTLAQVMTAMPANALKGGQNIANAVKDAAGIYMSDRAVDMARADLESANPDYHNLVNEYRDGILLFEISNRNVWQRAADDKEGLEQFFKQNRSKYTWESPKFKSYIIFASNDSLLGEAMTFAQTLPVDMAPTDVVKSIRDKFGRDVKVERVIAAKGENAITDYLAFGGEKPSSDNARWPSYAAFRGRVIEAPEEAADVRGAVVADFQAELERRWVEGLRAKYPVKINQKVMGQVK